eukprot:jgi/Tetstr1/445457/TSEL_033236.t1
MASPLVSVPSVASPAGATAHVRARVYMRAAGVRAGATILGTGCGRGARRRLPMTLGDGPRGGLSGSRARGGVLVAAAGPDGGASAGLRLIVYTKPDCPLCDGLKEKLDALVSQGQFMPTTFSAATIEMQDITTNPEWQQTYEMQVPVLRRVDSAGNEVTIPRPSPRLSAERLLKHIEKAIAA